MLGLNQRLLRPCFGFGIFFKIFLGIFVGRKIFLQGNGEDLLLRVIIIDDLCGFPLFNLIEIGSQKLAPNFEMLGIFPFLHLIQLQSQFLFAALDFSVDDALQVAAALGQEIVLLLVADELFQQLAHRVQRVLFILVELLQREGCESQRLFAVADKGRRIIFLRNQIAQPQ